MAIASTLSLGSEYHPDSDVVSTGVVRASSSQPGHSLSTSSPLLQHDRKWHPARLRVHGTGLCSSTPRTILPGPNVLDDQPRFRCIPIAQILVSFLHPSFSRRRGSLFKVRWSSHRYSLIVIGVKGCRPYPPAARERDVRQTPSDPRKARSQIPRKHRFDIATSL
jgi:hypothetical protein